MYSKPLDEGANSKAFKVTEISRTEPSLAATNISAKGTASGDALTIMSTGSVIEQQRTSLLAVASNVSEACDSKAILEDQPISSKHSPSSERPLPTNPFDDDDNDKGEDDHDDNKETSDPLTLCEDRCDSVIQHIANKERDGEREGTITALESNPSDFEENPEANDSNCDDTGVQQELTPMISSVDTTHHTIDEQLSLATEAASAVVSQINIDQGLQSYGLPAITLDCTAAVFDSDNERFQSFDYVDCTLVDAPKPPLNQDHAPGQFESGELQHRRSLFDVFEDALEQLAGGMFETPATEEVYVVQNQLNEEDSLVLLEDSALDAMDAVDYSPDNVDPVDIAPSEEECITPAVAAQRVHVIAELARVQAGMRVDEDWEHTHVAVTGEAAGSQEEEVRITIPTYTLRKCVDAILDVPALDYDDELPRQIVLTTVFYRGRRCYK
ncbi:hypothetical protein PINS_up015620 [Pythium insidiosum]|nr:hypothetical protein PINS_up015620 [Pythium insidiosum]